jgi:signal transduction histidine kinase/ActR/RegA family two-component response regulator
MDESCDDLDVFERLAAIHRATSGAPGLEEVSRLVVEAAAVALSNAQTYATVRAASLESERRNRALVRLQEASVQLLNVEEEAPSHDRLIEVLCHATGAPRGLYGRVEAQGESPRLVACGTYGVRRTPRNEIDRRMAELLVQIDLASDHPVARAARTMALVSVPDTGAAGDESEVLELWSRTGVRCVLAVPLRARGRLLGVVALAWEEPERASDEAVVKTAEVIANQVAAALDASALVDELSRANRLKDEFLATLSHELRNPLNVIVGYTELLSRDPAAQQLATVRRAAEVIRRNALTQAQLVSDLLDLSRLQTGKLTIRRQPISLLPLLVNAVETVRADANAKLINVRIERREDQILIHADPVRVQQIIWNLLHNAVKFTPEGGKVRISLERDGPDARLSVEDTGQGLDPGFLPSLFEMFRQAEAGTGRRHGGMGIGLAIVRQLVELHGGRVLAESEGKGKGTRFTVWLPLQRISAQAPAAVPKGVSGALAKVRVLIVDDSVETTSMLSQLLEHEGADVATARSGLEALDLARSRDFDVIVSDISMPGMDGYQLLHELRLHPRTAGTPAIAVTGFGQTEDADRAHAAGFCFHLTKPVQLSRLVEATRAALQPPTTH